MSLYSERIKAHLAAYKREKLHVAEDGRWRANGRGYEHILPESEKRLNVLETIRDDFWAYFAEHERELALHTDFHHLNSSQAFAFNLFFPWAATTANHADLLAALGVPSDTLARWSFEHMPDQEERTTFDFYAEVADGARIFVEVKLTEEQFGSVFPDDRYRTKWRDVYLPRLAGKTIGDGIEESVCFLNYQLFRNVSHLDIDRGDQLKLIVPRENDFTWHQAESFLDHLAPSIRNAVRLISAEDLCRDLSARTSGRPQLDEHVRLLRAKYFLGDA